LHRAPQHKLQLQVYAARAEQNLTSVGQVGLHDIKPQRPVTNLLCNVPLGNLLTDVFAVPRSWVKEMSIEGLTKHTKVICHAVLHVVAEWCYLNFFRW